MNPLRKLIKEQLKEYAKEERMSLQDLFCADKEETDEAIDELFEVVEEGSDYKTIRVDNEGERFVMTSMSESELYAAIVTALEYLDFQGDADEFAERLTESLADQDEYEPEYCGRRGA